MDALPKIIIDNTTVLQDFKELLKRKENKRILFSAPFGSGKSYFLKEFFKESEEYINVNLYPVDYPVVSNTDIFEIIKHDILNTLLDNYEEDIELQENDFSKFSMVLSFIFHKLNYYDAAKKVLPGLIPGLIGAIDGINAVKEILTKYKENVNDITRDEFDIVIEYIASIRNTKGSIRESDEITGIISDFLARIKAKRGNKPFVLIIDDLDRLDPDHIFRLINIFTAHFNSQEENKFGFDRVILVCDVNSLRHMFKHRYGEHANFNGYIDKFYSVKPFVFDNRTHLAEKIDDLISRKSSLANDGVVDRSTATVIQTYGLNSDFYNVFKHILINLINLDILKIRNFDRFDRYAIPKTTFKNLSGRSYESYFYEFLFLLHQLEQFFVTKEELRLSIKILSDDFSANYNESDKYAQDSAIEHYLINITLPFIIDEHIAFGNIRSTPGIRSYKLLNEHLKDLHVQFEMDENNSYWNSGVNYKFCSAEINGNRLARPNVYWFLLKAMENCDLRKVFY